MRQGTYARISSRVVLLSLVTPAMLVAQPRAAAPAPVSTQGMVLGTVRDTLGRPVGQVEIIVVGTTITSLSTDDGAYLLVGVPAGRVPLSIRRLGFEAISAEVTLEAGTELRVDIDLTPTPAVLEEIAVLGQRSLNASKLDRFHERRKTANGFFLTEEQIAKRALTTPTDLLRNMHRVKIVPLRAGYGNLVRIGSGKAQCTPAIYLDGLKVTEGEIDAIAIERIIAVEVYPRAVDVPLPYQGSFDCGVIGFWMRTGPTPPSRDKETLKAAPQDSTKRRRDA